MAPAFPWGNFGLGGGAGGLKRKSFLGPERNRELRVGPGGGKKKPARATCTCVAGTKNKKKTGRKKKRKKTDRGSKNPGNHFPIRLFFGGGGWVLGNLNLPPTGGTPETGGANFMDPKKQKRGAGGGGKNASVGKT